VKFVYITDVHFRETTPRNRKDPDILKTLEDKFKKLAVFCKENGVEFIVHGGDLGHNWDWRLSLLNRVDKIIKSLGIPFYTIIGNHDVPGKSLTEYPNTGLAFLEKLGTVTILHPEKTSIGPYDFYGYHSDTDECNKVLDGGSPPLSKDRISIAICHAPVGKTGLGHEIHYKKLNINKFDFAFFGDIHSGFPIYTNTNGVTLGNPGSFFRQSLTECKQPVGCYLVENKTVTFHQILPVQSNLFKSKHKITSLFTSTKDISKLNKVKISDYKLFDKVGKLLGINKKIIDDYYTEYNKL
jgi:hypothetical protein